MDDNVLCCRSIVAAAIRIDNRGATNLKIGFSYHRFGFSFIGTVLRGIVVFTVTASEQLSDIDLLGTFSLGRDGIVALACRNSLGRGTHKGVPRIVNVVLSCCCTYCCQLRGHCRGGADGSCNIVAAKELINDDVIRSMFAVNVYERAASHIGLTGTSIDLMDITFID